MLFFGFFSPCFAGGLEFDQVLLISNSDTVPAGKVWKVESVIYNIPHQNAGYATSSSSSYCSSGYYRNYAITIDGTPTKVGQGSMPTSYSSAAYMHSYTMLPIWLPAGTTLDGGPCQNKISVIEFTLIP